jgi:hypothetical protein
MAMSKPLEHTLARTPVIALKTPGGQREGGPERCKAQAHLGKRHPPLGTRPHIRGAEALPSSVAERETTATPAGARIVAYSYNKSQVSFLLLFFLSGEEKIIWKK